MAVDERTRAQEQQKGPEQKDRELSFDELLDVQIEETQQLAAAALRSPGIERITPAARERVQRINTSIESKRAAVLAVLEEQRRASIQKRSAAAVTAQEPRYAEESERNVAAQSRAAEASSYQDRGTPPKPRRLFAE